MTDFFAGYLIYIKATDDEDDNSLTGAISVSDPDSMEPRPADEVLVELTAYRIS